MMSLSAALSWLSGLYFLLSVSVCAASSAATDSLVKVTDCSFGEVYAFSPAGCSFALENLDSKPVSISIVPGQPGSTVEPSKLELPPHSSANVRVGILTDNIAGAVASTFRVEREKGAPLFVRARGFVMSVLDNPRPKIDFGDVETSKGSISKSVELTSSLKPDLRIKEVLSAPSFVRTVIGENPRTLIAEIGKDAPWGVFEESVKISIDAPQQKQVWVELVGNVIGDVGPEMNPYWFGSIPWQASRTLTLQLIDREGRDFTIGAITAKDFAATFDSADCEPARNGCRTLLIHVSDSQPPGVFRAHLDVALPDRNRHLALTIWGILGGKPAGEAKMGQSSPTVPNKAEPRPREIARTASPPPLKVLPEPPGKGPLLKWTVAQQGNVYGYQIFRGDSPVGTFTLLNSQIIHVVDNGNGPVKYQWRDTTAEKGRAYWYYIAILYKNGTRQSLSGAQKAIGK